MITLAVRLPGPESSICIMIQGGNPLPVFHPCPELCLLQDPVLMNILYFFRFNCAMHAGCGSLGRQS